MKQKLTRLSLELFNAVPKGPAQQMHPEEWIKFGLILDEHASYAHDEVRNYIEENQLSAEQLNATFHKSWQVIQDSSRLELFLHQILHYMSTYGTNFTSEYIYFPAEELEIPELKKLPLKIIRGLEPAVLTEKALKLLGSGIALQEETVDKLLEILEELKYEFSSVEHIKNKEALVKVIAKTGIYPEHPSEFLRFLVYKATGSALLIKNDDTIEGIKTAGINISHHLDAFGLKKCAEVFNRFKPLWLAFKSNEKNAPLINQISRLSKTHHKPLPVDVLNTITSVSYSESEIKAALSKVNNFRKARVLNALNTRINAADTFLYRIRNGKSFAKEKPVRNKIGFYKNVFEIIYWDLIDCLNLEGKTIRYPNNVDYALPVSEKMFVGNYPSGTKVTAENLASGIYWEDKWGANDLDLSALSLGTKVGWNSDYKSEGLMYSGDITSAPNGATELLYVKNNLPGPSLSINNIFSGKEGCKFKIIVGAASDISANYMFDPNELILEAETNMVSRQQILGIFLPGEGKTVSFILINTGFGSMGVSTNSVQSDNARTALFYQYCQPISFRKVLQDAGAILTESETCDLDLSPRNLQKDTLINILN